MSQPDNKPDVDAYHFEDAEAFSDSHQRQNEGSKEEDIHSHDNLSLSFKHDLHRGLKSRQIAMVVPFPKTLTDIR